MTKNKGCLATILSIFGSQPRKSGLRAANTRLADQAESASHVGTAKESLPATVADGNLVDIQELKTLPDELPYRVRDNFLSYAELSFYHVLRSVVGDSVVICPEMNLSSIFFVARPNENQAFRTRIAQKSIDFLLCEPKTMKPLVGIELDDTSHARPNREARDEFVNKVFAAADLPLLRIPAQRAYTTSELARQLEPFIGTLLAATPSALPAAAPVGTLNVAQPDSAGAAEPQPPICPKCGIPMVVRVVSQGQHKGRKFYGCTNYPQCRQMLPYPEAKPSTP